MKVFVGLLLLCVGIVIVGKLSALMGPSLEDSLRAQAYLERMDRKGAAAAGMDVESYRQRLNEEYQRELEDSRSDQSRGWSPRP